MTVKEAMLVLGAAFPGDRHSNEQTRTLYERKLSDIPPDLLSATVERVINTGKFFPSISDIRRTAAELAGLLPASPEEALAIIRKADVRKAVLRRDGSYAYTECCWQFPEDMSEITRRAIESALERAGDVVGRDGKDIFAWETGFKALYSVLFSAEEERVLMDLSQAKLLPGGSKPLLLGTE